MHAQGGKGELENFYTSEAEPEKPIFPSIEPVRKRDRLARKETVPGGPRPDDPSDLVRLWRVGHGGEGTLAGVTAAPGDRGADLVCRRRRDASILTTDPDCRLKRQ